ncbi:hypothetical protein HYU12_00130 [Candidatus Woesearchaeota archaeon]|nr:hypothetical protein [Candidatus Woesearchaeota archaeon]
MPSKAQTISADAIIAVALFMVAAILLFSVSTDKTSEKKTASLEAESQKLISAVSGEKDGTEKLIVGAKVNEKQLEYIEKNLDYKQLKDSLGINADFCIYFEDENKNIIDISSLTAGIGNDQINIDGKACGNIAALPPPPPP